MDTQHSSDAAYDRDQLDRLVQATARKDRQAFAELFAFYAPRVKAYLLRLNASDSLAEELSQEVMLTVWRKAEQFDSSQASASTWIFRIARNRRIDAARRDNKPELSPDEPALLPSEPEAPDQATHASFRTSRIQDAMATSGKSTAMVRNRHPMVMSSMALPPISSATRARLKSR